MPQLSDNIKKKRTSDMIKLSDELEKKYYNKFVGSKLEVLFEQSNDDYTIGHTSNYLEVWVKRDDSLISKIENVYLESLKNGFIMGKIVKK